MCDACVTVLISTLHIQKPTCATSMQQDTYSRSFKAPATIWLFPVSRFIYAVFLELPFPKRQQASKAARNLRKGGSSEGTSSLVLRLAVPVVLLVACTILICIALGFFNSTEQSRNDSWACQISGRLPDN